jgi:hypothetical protein
MLLETLRTGAQFCISGRDVPPNVTVPTVEPAVLAWKQTASIVFACGELTAGQMFRLGLLVLAEARRPEIRIVWLCPVILRGRLGSLRCTAAAIEDARKHAAVIAFLDGFAFGPSLWLAYQCDMQFASPTAQIGHLSCYRESDGQYDHDVTAAMIEDLAEQNPLVSRDTLARMDHHAISGELAEASGVLRDGNLKRDVFVASGIDGSKWPEVAR